MSNPASSEATAAYRRSFENTWTEDATADEVRFVVLDCEMTGLSPRRDRIVSIGAIAVVHAQILIGDSFETLLRVTHNTAATLVHGITRTAARHGMDEREALLALLDYLRDGVIVGHHISHDIAMLDAACRRHFDLELSNLSIDTLDLTLHLERDGAFGDSKPLSAASLDALCERFGVIPYDRHTAPGDAFLTAQIFLRLLRYGNRCGRGTLKTLTEPFRTRRNVG
jgi:DNA polymerase-3 subunit epsilon